MPVMITGRRTAASVGMSEQPTIADVDTSTVDGTYGAEESAVITSLRTKVNAILAQLEAADIFASA